MQAPVVQLRNSVTEGTRRHGLCDCGANLRRPACSEPMRSSITVSRILRRALAFRGSGFYFGYRGLPRAGPKSAALRTNSRVITTGGQSGSEAALDFEGLMAKEANVIGSLLRNPRAAEKARIMQRAVELGWSLFASRATRPAADRVFVLEQMHEAHTYFRLWATPRQDPTGPSELKRRTKKAQRTLGLLAARRILCSSSVRPGPRP